ncbi:MAG: hypothetical protein OEV91_11880, partial [Desulfobulbaceae bacterium]|nr:hypothetical protein [Desulfobulbaceae bacterium]
FLLIGVSYASINLMNIYLNLTGPVMIGLAYFSGARIYAMAARKILEKSVVMSSIAADGELYGAIMLIRFKGGGEFAGEKEVARIRRSLGRQGSQAKSVEVLKGGQKGIWGLLEGVIAVSWTCQAEDGPGQALILREAKTVEEISAQLWLADGGRPDAISFIFHQGRLAGGEQARAGWTMLFGEALMRWQKTERREA